jgi:hypothetical protein
MPGNWRARPWNTRAPGGWSVPGDLAAVDVQDLTGDERR